MFSKKKSDREILNDCIASLMQLSEFQMQSNASLIASIETLLSLLDRVSLIESVLRDKSIL